MASKNLMQTYDESLQGLSEREVADRRARGLHNNMPVKTSRSYGAILRENVFVPINNVLFVLGFVLVMLGKVSDALISVGVIMLNIVVSVTQEVRAKRTLDRIALLTRPLVAVIRDGQERQVDPGEIVIDDMLIVGPGDQIVVDGPVLSEGRIDVDESLLTGESDLVPKRRGDMLYSGSFCVNGKAFYKAEKVGTQSTAYAMASGARAFRRIYTPLQREINLAIRIILLLACFFEFLLVLGALSREVPFVEFIQNSVVIVGIVPQGLFLAITVAYTIGALRIAREGTLIQQVNAVESLSNIDVLCMDKTGTLTTNSLKVERVLPIASEETELRHLLGDFVASGTAPNKTSTAIGEACAGQARHVIEEVPFSSIYKWSGLALDEPGMRGVYVLGAVEVLEPALRPGYSLRDLVESEAAQGLRVVLFAFVPEPVPLRDAYDTPALPANLTPLGLVCLRDELRPEARETLEQFRSAGIRCKIISGDDPQTVAALARQAGLTEDINVVSGLELEQMDATQFAQFAEKTTIFGRITPHQKERLVEELRKRRHYVAMIGDGVNDVLSLKKANIGIAVQSGSQATRNVADIVLINDSFASLPPAFREGQRIRNGMQNILKLFLTRVLYIVLLLIETLVIGGFPFAPKQVSLLTLLTVGLPTLALAAWARPGQPQTGNRLHSLWHFVLTASIMIGIMAIFVYVGEYALRVLITLSNNVQVDVDTVNRATGIVAQSAVTTFTVLCGIILILFVDPPARFWTGGSPCGGDRRVFYLAGGMLVLYVILLVVPAFRSAFDLQPLDIADYAVIVILVIVWLFLTRWFWRARLLERFLNIE